MRTQLWTKVSHMTKLSINDIKMNGTMETMGRKLFLKYNPNYITAQEKSNNSNMMWCVIPFLIVQWLLEGAKHEIENSCHIPEFFAVPRPHTHPKSLGKKRIHSLGGKSFGKAIGEVWAEFQVTVDNCGTTCECKQQASFPGPTCFRTNATKHLRGYLV